MGHRDDDFLDEQRADAAVRRVLARLGEPALVEPPADLVARAARRLPSLPPAASLRRESRRRLTRLLLGSALLGATALAALLGLAGALGGGPQLAMLFGDGGAGASRVLLMLQLLTKPLTHTVGTLGATLALGVIVALASAAAAWWLLRRTPAYVYAESPS